MKLYLSKTLSDENDGHYANEGKLAIIYSNKNDLLNLCNFFEKVKLELSKENNLHLHFRDSFDSWSKKDHIDIEVNLEK